jgi:hypothetical protein
MVSVGGCCPEEDGACVRVGPEPASAADKLFVTVSISVVQGPALAELGIHDNSAKLASMRIGWFITSSFRQVARRKRWFGRAVPAALLAGCASCTHLLNQANTVTVYRNAAEIGSSTTPSNGVPNSSMYLSASNRNGVRLFEPDEIAAFFVGAALNKTQTAGISVRINQFLKVFGTNAYLPTASHSDREECPEMCRIEPAKSS